MDALALRSVLAALVYSVLGIVVFGVAFKIVDALTPYHLWRQPVEEKNVALAIVVGAMALSIALIVASAIHLRVDAAQSHRRCSARRARGRRRHPARLRLRPPPRGAALRDPRLGGRARRSLRGPAVDARPRPHRQPLRLVLRRPGDAPRRARRRRQCDPAVQRHRHASQQRRLRDRRPRRRVDARRVRHERSRRHHDHRRLAAIERRAIAPRADWQAKAEAVGMIFHHTHGEVYWNESAHYRLTSADVELIETATNETVDALMTGTYLRDTAEQAGYQTIGLHVGDIGWHHIRGFTDLDERPILNLFKLYPWEWLLREAFASHLSPGLPYWIEPSWRMILSNKSILPILWELFPNHPNLLPAFREPAGVREWVKKPRFGREGQNVEVRTATGGEEQPGEYGDEGFVYQQYFALPVYDGRRAVVGSWVVDQESAGVGIRESEGLITRNESPFVPHVIEDR